MSDWNTFYKAYKEAPESSRNVIDSNIISAFLDLMIVSSKIDKKYKSQLIIIVSDAILEIIQPADVPDALQKIGIDSNTAATITLEIKKFVESPDTYMKQIDASASNKSKTVDEAAKTPVPVTNEETSQQKVLPTPKADSSLSALKNVSETTEPIVQPLRTMEKDVDKVHGYGAYRKMYPTPTTESAIPEPIENTPVETGEEKVVQATAQDETLNGKKSLTNTPTYTDGTK